MNFGGSEPASVCGRPSMMTSEIAEIRATFCRNIIKPFCLSGR
jgi:hypothetical protein